MKQTIGFYEFREAFKNFDRLDNFPNGGLSVLWDFLESYEEDTGEEIELDVVGLCCDYCQMSFEDIVREYGLDLDPEDKDAILDYLNDNTMVVGQVDDDDVIFANF